MHCHKINALIVSHLPLRETWTTELIPEHTWLHHFEALVRNLLAVGLIIWWIKVLNERADDEKVPRVQVGLNRKIRDNHNGGSDISLSSGLW